MKQRKSFPCEKILRFKFHLIYFPKWRKNLHHSNSRSFVRKKEERLLLFFTIFRFFLWHELIKRGGLIIQRNFFKVSEELNF